MSDAVLSHEIICVVAALCVDKAWTFKLFRETGCEGRDWDIEVLVRALLAKT